MRAIDYGNGHIVEMKPGCYFTYRGEDWLGTLLGMGRPVVINPYRIEPDQNGFYVGIGYGGPVFPEGTTNLPFTSIEKVEVSSFGTGPTIEEAARNALGHDWASEDDFIDVPQENGVYAAADYVPDWGA